jgi:hypothetical protein
MIFRLKHPVFTSASVLALSVHSQQGGGVSFADVQQFYRDLAAAVSPLPVVAYHIPAITGMQMTSSQLLVRVVTRSMSLSLTLFYSSTLVARSIKLIRMRSKRASCVYLGGATGQA